jgi:hypothetical protein
MDSTPVLVSKLAQLLLTGVYTSVRFSFAFLRDDERNSDFTTIIAETRTSAAASVLIGDPVSTARFGLRVQVPDLLFA